MSVVAKVAALAAVVVLAFMSQAHAEKKTVCTITVNSADEKETFRRYLPQEDFDFVELVEPARPDWLASACQKSVRCDLLVISGHFDDGTQFYSDRLDARESLPVAEMERVACSNSCPGLFSQLKEVYLFGCNTLSSGALRTASPEIGRSLVRAGLTAADAERLAREIGELHADSNRDRMRQIFKDVPLIYGFSSKAPLGPTAGALLTRYFQSGATDEVGSGRPSAKLLGLFAPLSMTTATGLRDGEPQAGYRSDVCQFADDRLSPAQKLEFVHGLFARGMADTRMFLDRIETLSVAVTAAAGRDAALAQALSAIAHDAPARERFLAFARDADDAAVRARMIRVAGRLGWLSDAQQQAEWLRLLRHLAASSTAGPAEVDLVCRANQGAALGVAHTALPALKSRSSVAHAAILACLGDAAARKRVLAALTSPSERDVEIAQIYLRHYPVVDVEELRIVATGIGRMAAADAQVRALETLAGYRLADPESLEALMRLFPMTRSIGVQRAIAGVLIRADHQALAKPELVRVLRQHRIKSPDGQDMIDILVRRLQVS
jgi:hypothetical protein